MPRNIARFLGDSCVQLSTAAARLYSWTATESRWFQSLSSEGRRDLELEAYGQDSMVACEIVTEAKSQWPKSGHRLDRANVLSGRTARVDRRSTACVVGGRWRRPSISSLRCMAADVGPSDRRLNAPLARDLSPCNRWPAPTAAQPVVSTVVDWNSLVYPPPSPSRPLPSTETPMPDCWKNHAPGGFAGHLE